MYNTKQFSEALEQIEEYVKIANPDAVSFQMKALIYEELEDELWEIISERQIDLISGDQSIRKVEDLYGAEIFP